MMNRKKLVGLIVSVYVTMLIFSCSNDKKIDYYKLYQQHASQVKGEAMHTYFNSDNSGLFGDSIVLSKRKYLTDGSFIDYNIFGSSDTDVFCSINFKVRDDIWYVFSGEKWQIFYANQKLHNVDMLYSNQSLIPEKSYVLNGMPFIGFSCKDNEWDFTSHSTTYWFSPKYGIVVVGERDHFRRADFPSTGLQELMDSIYLSH